ncbi:MAG: DEAD/DEAH box helicase [Candidatus Scalindua sp. AMX11]|nr:MAG: helicase c2 [Candidatus Scalindua sp.]NOG84585.1 DEAD/DEAH box helicase [Planctomycetota bacterium]RZV92360.1 MAG: DEAD/DEAH box helicase [Candidatus Scalindua sp. SCAELEC01]TDE66115.1 MAG: DEAD/DEAH box helicase [Candidatus Scalindua sp. AMX11]GJQ59089.1 MAG: ATP-dependent helicase [Candidatus Scalindua sp.]
MLIEDVFGKKGILAKNLMGYEARPQQIEMAHLIGKSINENRHLIVEAGTGVGKSLAYLVPYILWSSKKNRKVVISTYTKTLQEQLVQNDLPFLRDVLRSVSLGTGSNAFSFAICIGGQNYLCLRRFNQVQQQGLLETREEAKAFEEIIKWEGETKSGVRSELEFEPSRSTWGNICRESDLCFGKKCEFKEECYYNKARRREFKAQILVTNHHLFFANLVNDGCVLPKFDAVVFDEAHTLESVATSYFSIEISNLKVKFLLDAIFNPKTGKGMLPRYLHTRKKGVEIEQALVEAKEACDLLFSEAMNTFSDERVSKRIMQKGAIDNVLSKPLSNISSLLRVLRDQAKREDEGLEIEAYARRCDETNQNLSTFIDQDLEEGVFWAEVRGRQKTGKTRFSDALQLDNLFEPLSHSAKRCSLFAAPINIADEFRRQVFNKIRPVVLTSATLSTNGNFHYIKERLGVPARPGNSEAVFHTIDTGGLASQVGREECIEKCIGSPFNFSKNALIYLPENISDPNREPGEFKLQIIEQIKDLLIITQGRSFVLFTSFEMLNGVYEGLKKSLSSFTIFRQGDKPRYKLVEEFKRSNKSILFGTITFWQGIDVPGKALECVIITRLPFAVPDDPIIEARMELLKKQQKSPFIHYQIPQAITLLRQGFGRLIRTKSDIGIVAILDPRIKTKHYGKFFLNSLPNCEKVTDIKLVERFFDNHYHK